MTQPLGGAPLGEFDVFGVATGCTLVVGALSILAPFLTALAGTLAALVLAGWCSTLRRDGTSLRRAARPDRGFALVTFGLGVFLFLSPVGLATFRGLLLGLAVLPLWAVERRVRRGASAREDLP